MKSAKMIIATIIGLILLNVTAPEMLSFFDIPYNSYAPYLHWFTTLGLFYIILPDEKSSIFR